MNGVVADVKLPDGSRLVVEEMGPRATLIVREVAGRGIVWGQAFDPGPAGCRAPGSIVGDVVRAMYDDPGGFDREILWHEDGSAIR